jgi:hypothetical protein
MGLLCRKGWWNGTIGGNDTCRGGECPFWSGLVLVLVLEEGGAF